MRVADYIASSVQQTGTDCLFLLVGGMAMHLNDAFGRVPGLKYVCVHHEQSAAMAADAYARVTGKIGVAMATSGAGATNLLTGLVGAYQDSVPVLFLTGQCKRVETIRGRGIPGLRQAGFCDVDIVSMVEGVTKYAAAIESPERARFHLEKALYMATNGRPGPVLLDVPLDIQAAQFDTKRAEGFTPEDAPLQAKPEDVASIMDRLASAKRPVILAGHGIRCAGMTEAFRKLVHRLNVPVATSLMAKDLLCSDDPVFIGHCGPRGLRGANFAVQVADLIVSMGCSLHIQTVGYEGDLFAPNAHKIQIDVDESLLARETIGVHEKYRWDIRDYLPKMLDHLAKPGNGNDPRWMETCSKWTRKYSIWEEPHEFGPSDGPANLYETVSVLNEVLKGDEIVLTDAGQPHPILGQAFAAKGMQRYINPGSMAEMGYALPASLGLAAGCPDRTVVAVFGDGSFQTNVQELQALVHNGFNIKLFIINNGGYGSIRRTQKAFFNGYFVGCTPESGVSMPVIEKIAHAYGVPYLRCKNRGSLRDCVLEALSRKGPVLCEIPGQYDQAIMPAVPSYMLPDGRMRSKALHEMAPATAATFENALTDAGLDLA